MKSFFDKHVKSKFWAKTKKFHLPKEKRAKKFREWNYGNSN